MNTMGTATSPESLRNAMVTKVKDAGHALGLDVEPALRSVQRHVFVPGVALEEAYANDIVVTKRGPDGQVLSCLSQVLPGSLPVVGMSTFTKVPRFFPTSPPKRVSSSPESAS
jgi:hypothetical protein